MTSVENQARTPESREGMLKITEIFHSLQGEALQAGLRTVFIRLTGCPLRCAYCDSEYSDNAQYWLGESYYVTRNYDLALTAFQDLLDRFPDSPKAPDALLKIGYTHYELEQWDSARAALTQVQEQYPDSTLSRLAENRLRSMRMEGHY